MLGEKEKELGGQKDSTGYIKKSNIKASKKTMQKKHQELVEIEVIAKLDLGGGKRGRRCWGSRREGGDEGRGGGQRDGVGG